MIAEITIEHIGTWSIALAGWLVAVIQIYISRRDRAQTRDEQLLQTTLSFFDGGTQKRSLGIAMIEGVWRKRTDYVTIFAPVLVNQAIYLLRASEEANQPHEERNLIRVLRLLEDMLPLHPSRSDISGDLLDSIGIAHRHVCGSEKPEGPLSSSTLEIWFNKFGGSKEDLKQYG